MSGGIAILGWGSLVWDLEALAPRVSGGWAMRAGPRLPMEFSRISVKRRMGLVVCLDPEAGVPCPTNVIASRRTGLEATVADLALRERAPHDRIGWARASGDGESRLPAVADAVAAWCVAAGWTAAVWTDLEPNFRETTGRRYGVPEAIDYLRGLRGPSLAEAHRYIRNAPCGTRTPLRRALTRDPWWRAVTRRTRGGVYSP